MLLAVDVGNTQTVFGLYDDAGSPSDWRVATEAQRTGDELGALLGGLPRPRAVDGVCLSSTVPRLVRSTSTSPSAGRRRDSSSSARASAPGSRSSTTRRAKSARTGS